MNITYTNFISKLINSAIFKWLIMAPIKDYRWEINTSLTSFKKESFYIPVIQLCHT